MSRKRPAVPVLVKKLFEAGLPSPTFRPWERSFSTLAAAICGAAVPVGTEFTQLLHTTDKSRAIVLFDVEQQWLDAGLDPTDPDSLSALQDNQGSYGRVPFNLKFNGSVAWDVKESVYDLNSGSSIRREAKGFTRLNVNLMGARDVAHAIAYIVKPNTKIEVSWTKLQTPGRVPTDLLARLRGWSLPFKEIEAVFGTSF